MLCILAVFIPSFFMQGAARALFVPLSLAVGFAMVASYLLSSTFVPVLSRLAAAARPARGRDGDREAARSIGSATRYGRLSARGRRGCAGWSCRPTSPSRRLVICRRRPRSSAWRSSRRSTPASSSSACAAPAGTRIEQTEQLAQRGARRRSSEEVGAGERRDHRSATSACDPVELPDQRDLPVDRRARRRPCCGSQLKHGGGRRRSSDLKERLRERAAAGDCPTCGSAFEPADIVSEVMSFGSPTPVEVAVSGPNLADNRAYAEKVRERAGEGPVAARPPVSARRSTTRPSRSRSTASGPALSGVTAEEVGPLARRGHLVEPVRRAELLGRPQERHRLPGAGRGPDASG